MNAFVVFFAALAVANAGVIAPVGVISHSVVAPAVKSTHIQGPSTSTHIVGPDGSQIVAHAPGASISTAEHVGVATEVVAPAVEAYAAPVLSAHAAPVLAAYSTAYNTPVAHAAPVISTYGGAYGTVSAYGAPVIARTLIASPLTASGYPLLAPGSGLEGQYVPDINEKLYDDGSYKGEIY